MRVRECVPQSGEGISKADLEAALGADLVKVRGACEAGAVVGIWLGLILCFKSYAHFRAMRWPPFLVELLPPMSRLSTAE